MESWALLDSGVDSKMGAIIHRTWRTVERGKRKVNFPIGCIRRSANTFHACVHVPYEPRFHWKNHFHMERERIRKQVDCLPLHRSRPTPNPGAWIRVKSNVVGHLATTTLIVMDGCSLPIDLTSFGGTIIMAASPSLYVKNLKDAVIISYRKRITMSAPSKDEARAIAASIGVEVDVVESNFCLIQWVV